MTALAWTIDWYRLQQLASATRGDTVACVAVEIATRPLPLFLVARKLRFYPRLAQYEPDFRVFSTKMTARKLSFQRYHLHCHPATDTRA
jgi:hypothetical protein